MTGSSTVVSKISDMGSLEREFARAEDLYSAEKAEDHANYLYQTIKQRFNLSSIKVISFDVFDTLLLRNSKYEPHRYLELSEKIEDFLTNKEIKQISAWDIYAARRTAFKVCYRTVSQNCRVREGRLLDVLDLMAKILNLEKWVIPELIKIELDYESENLTINPFLDVFLKIPEIKQKQIIFVSDMYMSGKHIYQLVVEKYPNLNLVKYYSSADYGITKTSGFLYGVVAQDLGVDCSSIIHMGDNIKGDVRQAKKNRVNAVHLPIPEAYLAERRREKEKFQQEMIACKMNFF